ncbi:hypothetical protein AMECASPLE_039777 [Ameca splendens]|uniref:Uncharacterized protein n=1 Tax=Ameca splendens TaxID=208324 RepID=A0ABV1AHK8_9TELE
MRAGLGRKTAHIDESITHNELDETLKVLFPKLGTITGGWLLYKSAEIQLADKLCCSNRVTPLLVSEQQSEPPHPFQNALLGPSMGVFNPSLRIPCMLLHISLNFVYAHNVGGLKGDSYMPSIDSLLQ